MAKWFGTIGFVRTVETAPDVWREQTEERAYYGDVITHKFRRQSGESVNDNIVLSNELSVISDPFAFEQLRFIRYATFMGAKWNVTSVEVQHPRLILTLGEVYHE